MSHKNFNQTNTTVAKVIQSDEIPSSEVDRLIAAGQSLATTSQTANYLNIKPQTLHRWACYQTGALKPIRVGRHLRWRLTDIASLIKGAAK